MKKYLIIYILLLFVLAGCQKADEIEQLDDTEQETIDYSNLAYASYLDNENPLVTITVKDYGVIKIQLFQEVAPITVANFITYILEGSYTDVIFHRIIEDFMIQGGIVDNALDPIIGEFSSNGIQNDLSHTRGVISMARTSVKNSATSQFFIVHKDSTYLDGNYAAFGGMVLGFDVLDMIAAVDTGYQDVPNQDVIIESITVELNGYTNNNQ